MRPKKPGTTGEGDLFRARLEQIINLKHELVQLAVRIDWDWIDREIAPDLDDLGHRIVRAFDVRERPFHFEFFRLPDGERAAKQWSSCRAQLVRLFES